MGAHRLPYSRLLRSLADAIEQDRLLEFAIEHDPVEQVVAEAWERCGSDHVMLDALDACRHKILNASYTCGAKRCAFPHGRSGRRPCSACCRAIRKLVPTLSFAAIVEAARARSR